MVSMNEIRKRCENNNRLFASVQNECIGSDVDIYSLVASKIFNKDYADCREQYGDGTWNPTGKMMRTIAKRICLNMESVDSLSQRFSIPCLSNLIITAFPFTLPEDIDDEIQKEDLIYGATTFLVNMCGYVRYLRLVDMHDKFEQKAFNEYFKED